MRGASIFRALLRCYPAPFREEYGGQMQLFFAEQLREAPGTQKANLWLAATRDAFTIGPKEHWHVIYQDIRYALRSMTAQPGFAAVAVLSLALGIGANTAIFSLWNSVLHATLPGVSHPEELAILTDPGSSGAWHGDSRGERAFLTYEEFEQLRDHTTSFSSMMASESTLERWQVRFGGRQLEETYGRLVSGGYFQFFGIAPVLGRTFTPEDDRSGAAYTVISYDYWQRRFAGRRDVLGTTFTLRNTSLTIVGVSPQGFYGETVGQDPDFWVTMHMQSLVVPGEDWLHDSPPAKMMWLHVFGRLKPGITLPRAQAESNAIFKAGLETFYGKAASGKRLQEFLDQRLKLQSAKRGASEARDDYSISLNALFVAVGLLLLIASANLANLLLARGAARKPELALRISLGASRGRIIRQLVTESLVLAAMGGATGLVAGWLVHGVLVRMIGESHSNFHMQFALDPSVMAFTLGITLLAATLFGLLPAWQVTRTDAGTTLKEQGRGVGGSLGRMRLGRSLVSLQLALSLPLLAGAGLLARTLYNLQHVPVGFSVEGLEIVNVNSRVAGYDSPRSMTLFANLLGAVQHIPGVKSATYSHNGLFTGSNSGDLVEVEGYTPKSDDDKDSSWDMVGPNFFSTVGVPILKGREILESDHTGAPRVCVINQAFAKKFFDGREPLGMHVTVVDEAPGGDRRTTYQVIGVAANIRHNELRESTIDPRFYEPFSQAHGDHVKRANFLIRTASDRTSVIGPVRQAFQRVDSSLPILIARSMREQLGPVTATERITAQVAIVFGCMALALAAIGLYGVLSYGIARRKGEIAVRIALGAEPGRVIAMVLRETTVLFLAGLILGGGLTYAATTWIASQLFGVAPQDPLTLTFAVLLLLVVAFTAVFLPARRASLVDPMTALRQE